jgi:uroporphyrinogen decarboxylase
VGDKSMAELNNDRLLRALRRQPVDVTPVWIMRQAGRYLPEYRQVRSRAGDFMTLCRTPELACEVTLQPLARFPLDAAILFSDILTIPDAMGLGLEFAEGEGPVFKRPVTNAAQIRRLVPPDPEQELRYVMDAVRLIARELNGRVPLLGFSGSPWTLATYMIEGGSSKDFTKAKGLLYDQPEVLRELLNILSHSVATYLSAQIQAGVSAVMIFDTWGGVLSPQDYKAYSLRPMHDVIDQLKSDQDSRSVPVILFTKGGGAWLEDMAETGCDALGIDWTVRMDEARRRVGSKVALQGNLDPSALYAPPERIKAQVGRILAEFGVGSGHIFNLGHGIHPDINPDHVSELVSAVHQLSQVYHVNSSA